jgi:N-acetylmuramoyl-L-alanine amidase
MALRKVVPSPVRASRFVAYLAPALILVTIAGCGHKRTSMRPVFTTPVPAGSGSTVVVPSGPTGTVTTEPDPSEPFLTPNTSSAAPSNSEPVIRTNNSPPVPNAADEPSLNDSGSGKSIPPASGAGGPELTKPSALRSTGRTASAPRRAPRVSLREAVTPFVSDPADLFQPPKADRPWKYVVVHHSANAKGGYDQIDRDHRKVLGFEGCGYHFVIGNGTDSPDGQIEIAERWLNQKNGVHCRNGRTPEINEYGIGICLVGNLDQAPPTPKQVAAARALVAYLAGRYQIPTDHVGSHDQFADGPTACPGKYFPSEAIFGTKHLAIH